MVLTTKAFPNLKSSRCEGHDWPAGFIAHHYTRYLGDLSGGQSIRRAVVRRYGLVDGRGVGFYDFPELGRRGAQAPLPGAAGRAAVPAAELDRLTEEVLRAYRLNLGVLDDLARATRELVDPFHPRWWRRSCGT